MSANKTRVLLLFSQTSQNGAALHLLENYPEFEFTVCYCQLPGASAGRGEEFLNKGAFDSLPPSDHTWIALRNYSPTPGLSHFFGLCNLGVVKEVHRHDCIVVFGHNYLTLILAIVAAVVCNRPLLLSTDAITLGSGIKATLKKWLLPTLYNLIATGVLVPSSRSKQFLQSLGVEESRIALTPYAIDNEDVEKRAQNGPDRRTALKIPATAPVVLFCGKLIERKGCADLIRAFISANVLESVLIVIGNGPLKSKLESLAAGSPCAEQIHFIGERSYAELPSWYVASDLIVVPSRHEPFGLVVNEAFACGRAVVASSSVGAGDDLIKPTINGFVYPVGDVNALSTILESTLTNREYLHCLGQNGHTAVQSWSPRENIKRLVEAVMQAKRRHSCQL